MKRSSREEEEEEEEENGSVLDWQAEYHLGSGIHSILKSTGALIGL
jgi:hypothetical protein